MQTNQTKKELFHIAGDTPESVSERTPNGQIRTKAVMDLTANAIGHPKIVYRSKASDETFILTADVYKFADAPIKVQIICPQCSKRGNVHGLSITGDHKKIEYNPSDPLTMVLTDEQGMDVLTDMGGRLDIERFKCTWEENVDAEVAQARGWIKGLNLCTFQVVIEKNVARDA